MWYARMEAGESVIAPQFDRVEGAGEDLVTKRFLFHMLFNRYFRQGSAIRTAVATDPPLLDPLLLHIGLPTPRTHKHALFIEHPSLFLHGLLFLRMSEDGTLPERIARLDETRTPDALR